MVSPSFSTWKCCRCGNCSILTAVVHSIKNAWERRLPSVIIESDSKKASDLILQFENNLHPLFAIILDCRALFVGFGLAVSFMFPVKRIAALIFLAKFGHCFLRFCCTILDYSPPLLLQSCSAYDLKPLMYPKKLKIYDSSTVSVLRLEKETRIDVLCVICVQ